jgi:uncharacterized protein YciI
MKTFAYAITVLFITAPLALAVEPMSGKGAKTLQDVGAVQGQEKIVTHGPKPADSARNTTVQPDVKTTDAQTLQDVGAIQGQNQIVTFGPKPADPGRDTNIQPDVKTGPKTLQDVGAVQGQDEIVTHGPIPSSTR